MARYKKNVKRIDPRYFLNETVLREGDEAALAQAGEEALADMGEEGILAQLGQLPPETQAEIQAAAAATAEEASQMNESGELDDSYLAGPRGSAMATGGVAGAGLGAAAGAVTSSLMSLATANAVGTVLGAAAFGASGGIIAAAVYILAKRMLQGK